MEISNLSSDWQQQASAYVSNIILVVTKSHNKLKCSSIMTCSRFVQMEPCNTILNLWMDMLMPEQVAMLQADKEQSEKILTTHQTILEMMTMGLHPLLLRRVQLVHHDVLNAPQLESKIAITKFSRSSWYCSVCQFQLCTRKV